MSDGSLRIEVEVHPTDAQAAFAMFGKPGAPMALAALVVGHAQAGRDAPTPEPAPKEQEPAAPKADHALSKWAALRCQDPHFREWLVGMTDLVMRPDEKLTAEYAADVMREICRVASRAEFDTDPAAAERFMARVMRPWQRHCVTTGKAAP